KFQLQSLMPAQTTTSASMPATTVNPSLQPRQTFNTQLNSFLQNTLDLPTNRISQKRSNLTVSSANALQNSQEILKGGGSATLFYTAGFPPTSTATLPRVAFDAKGVLSFYKSANQLSPDQLQSVQNLYAGDLASRKNYATNLANLARDLTSIENA